MKLMNEEEKRKCGRAGREDLEREILGRLRAEWYLGNRVDPGLPTASCPGKLHSLRFAHQAPWRIWCVCKSTEGRLYNPHFVVLSIIWYSGGKLAIEIEEERRKWRECSPV